MVGYHLRRCWGPRTPNPSRSAASARFRSRLTNSIVAGSPSAATRAAAICRASAARSGCVSTTLSAYRRTSSTAVTSDHCSQAPRRSRLAARSWGADSGSSRLLLASAESNSTRVKAHTMTSGSSRSQRLTRVVLRSAKTRGISAELSQNLTNHSCALPKDPAGHCRLLSPPYVQAIWAGRRRLGGSSPGAPDERVARRGLRLAMG